MAYAGVGAPDSGRRDDRALASLRVPPVRPTSGRPRSTARPARGSFASPQAIAYDASGVQTPPGRPGPTSTSPTSTRSSSQKFTTGGTFVRRLGGYGSEPGPLRRDRPERHRDGHDRRRRRHRRPRRRPARRRLRARLAQLRASSASRRPAIRAEFGRRAEQPRHRHQRRHRARGRRALRRRPEQQPRPALHLGADGAPALAPSFGAPGTAEGQFNLPQGIAVDPAGDHDVFVADDRNHRVQRFTAAGAFEDAVGSFGSGGAQFQNPYDAASTSATSSSWPTTRTTGCGFQASTLAWRTSYRRLRRRSPSRWPTCAPWRRPRRRPRAESSSRHVERRDRRVRRRRRVRADVGALGRRAAGRFTLPRSVALDGAGNFLVPTRATTASSACDPTDP